MERKIYIVIENYDHRGFVREVNEAIADGYVPDGGMVINRDGDYTQSMIDKEFMKNTYGEIAKPEGVSDFEAKINDVLKSLQHNLGKDIIGV